MFKTNDTRQFLISSEIVEWDIKAGNISMMEKYELATPKVMEKIKRMPKEKRVILVGLMMKKDKEFSKALEKAFNDTVAEFITDNDLDPSYDILSIKRDAVFVANRDIRKTGFGPAHFIPKNHYHAFLYLKPFEFYFFSDGAIDVKGMNDEELSYHKEGMLSFFRDLVELSEYEDPKSLTEYLIEFVNSYKKRELSLDYYRVFTNNKRANGKFHLNIHGDDVWMENIDDQDLDELIIDDNYKDVILPLINILAPY